MTLPSVFLVAAPAAGAGSFGGTAIMMIGVVAVFYFFMIRPQQKKQKAVLAAREAMKVGDKIVTAGGIHGKIREVSDTTFLVEIADNVRIKIAKASVFASTEDIPAN